jgi:demethylmenaquinone methyltransferase/2-methoxy-6-polyprenyl-1,4-benzoquinol methylase
MFGRIAHRYDLANLLLSGGLCTRWTRRLARAAAGHLTGPGAFAVDLATGSGDVAFALARFAPSARICGLDFCEPMLQEAKKRLAAARETTLHAKKEDITAPARITFRHGDCAALPLADASADVVTIAYGVRNLQDRPKGLREIHRVLRPGGSAFILEFSQPARWFSPPYYFYVRHILPTLARAATGDRLAYKYLGDSIATFPPRDKFSRELLDAGFCEVRSTALTLGIVAIHHARKTA